MKRFGASILTFLMPMRRSFGWNGLALCLSRYRRTLAATMLIGIVSFEAIAIQALAATEITPAHVLLNSLVLSLMLLGFVGLLSPMRSSRTIPTEKEINVAELLGREVIPLNAPEAHSTLRGRVVLVTGAAGSIGSELCRQLLNYEPGMLIALDNNETGLFDLEESLRAHPCLTALCLQICDIRDVQRLTRLFEQRRPDIIFHAAAYKHVPMLEHFPDQAVHTNALATYHLCLLAREYRVARFVFISTDKAAGPTSVMGATKRIGEMLIQSLAGEQGYDTCFCAVRFGNVIGSRGSVVPVFAQQIARGGPLTVTHPEATRYFMTIPEACGLVILTAALAQRGGLYLLDMGRPVRIADLATKMIQMHGLQVGRDITIVYTGLRPGERLHETLVGANEVLQPGTHSKIYCVSQQEPPPTLATIAVWMKVMSEQFHWESYAQLRSHLFEIVGAEVSCSVG